MFGAIDGPKPYKFIRFGAIDGPKPYKFIGFGARGAWRTRDSGTPGSLGAVAPRVYQGTELSGMGNFGFLCCFVWFCCFVLCYFVFCFCFVVVLFCFVAYIHHHRPGGFWSRPRGSRQDPGQLYGSVRWGV